MKLSLCLLSLSFILSAAGPAAPPLSKSFDQQVSMVEREVVSLAEAMPADRYGFVPTGPEFAKSRTFGQQAMHIAAVNYATAAAVLGEKNPIEMGPAENGPASIKGKAEIVTFLKDSFAYAHKAMGMVTAQNLNEMVASAFGKDQVPRVTMVTVPVWHTFDHYGQMVIYARMNGIVPPASR